MPDNVNDYLSNGDLFSKLSDITRIVDPLQKTVIQYKNKEVVIDGIHCFDFWGKNKVCDNCISMRAYNDNKTYVKIEYNKDKIYLITAVPHDLNDRRVVIEILKDITNSLLLSSYENEAVDSTGIHALIDNMNKFAYRDPLTGLYNRRYIIEKLPIDLLNATLLANEFSIIMADIDHFKLINDNYGHLAGDQALKTVAETLSCCIKRESDWIARYGGEEFLICIPGANLDFALKTAECMRKAIESTPIMYEDKILSLTASFGICSIKTTENKSVDDLLKLADEKLYSAKRNGRNRVEGQNGNTVTEGRLCQATNWRSNKKETSVSSSLWRFVAKNNQVLKLEAESYTGPQHGVIQFSAIFTFKIIVGNFAYNVFSKCVT